MDIQLTKQQVDDIVHALHQAISLLNTELRGWLDCAHPERRESHFFDVIERSVASLRHLTNLLQLLEAQQEKEKKER